MRGEREREIEVGERERERYREKERGSERDSYLLSGSPGNQLVNLN